MRGRTSSVATQCTSATASWLRARARAAPTTADRGQPRRRAARASGAIAAATPSGRAAIATRRGRAAARTRRRSARATQRAGAAPHARRALERAAAVVDEEVADVRARRAPSASRRRRELDRAPARDLVLATAGCACAICLDRVAVAVARREVHRRVDAGRVGAQRALDHAHRLDEVAPVGRAEEAQAADAVADRRPGRRPGSGSPAGTRARSSGPARRAAARAT